MLRFSVMGLCKCDGLFGMLRDRNVLGSEMSCTVEPRLAVLCLGSASACSVGRVLAHTICASKLAADGL